jgi:hypothetical protein
MMMTSSAALSHITTSMIALQSSTKSFLEKNSFESNPSKLKPYPALADLLGKEQSEILNPLVLKDAANEEEEGPECAKAPSDCFLLVPHGGQARDQGEEPGIGRWFGCEAGY